MPCACTHRRTNICSLSIFQATYPEQDDMGHVVILCLTSSETTNYRAQPASSPIKNIPEEGLSRSRHAGCGCFLTQGQDQQVWYRGSGLKISNVSSWPCTKSVPAPGLGSLCGAAPGLRLEPPYPGLCSHHGAKVPECIQEKGLNHIRRGLDHVPARSAAVKAGRGRKKPQTV